jgi:hypothetical protein
MTESHIVAGGRSFTIVCALLAACAAGLGSRHACAADEAIARAREILERHPLIDSHNDLPNVIRERGEPPRDVAAFDLRRPAVGDTDIARLRAGGVGGQFWSVYIPSSPEVGERGFARAQLEQIDIALRMIERYPEAFSRSRPTTSSARKRPGASPRCSASRAATPSRTRSVRCAPSGGSACAT